MNDSIADMIIRIKNAGAVSKETVDFPYSNLLYAVCEVLKKEGYIANVTKKGKKVPNKKIEVEVAYTGGYPRVTDAARVSKLSKRVYASAKDIKPVKQGRGILVLSTPNGIMTGDQARKEGVGGELLFKMW